MAKGYDWKMAASKGAYPSTGPAGNLQAASIPEKGTARSAVKRLAVCGICGFAGSSPLAEAERVLSRMNDSIFHRGPDDEGSYLSWSPGEERRGPSCALAMRRLAVIDLHSGKQPITNEDGTCWIVYNGEVYNFQELRVSLQASGHVFVTQTDTEVLLHAYEQYGVRCVEYFRGMFAFAIWDSRCSRLFLARDPVGVKPLFYTSVDGQLIFASEIKALLCYPGVRRALNASAVPHFLAYLYTPAPDTMFEGIYQLPPGHRMVFQDGVQTIEEYWLGPQDWLQRGTSPARDVSPASVWNGLDDSVSAHLVSDVPVGAFLSGGIDSSAIVALASARLGKQLKTFSIGFQGAGLYDESPYAQAMADYIGAEHHILHIDATSVERRKDLETEQLSQLSGVE